MRNCATSANLSILLLIVNQVAYRIVYCHVEPPTPVITLHAGHIGLYDRLLETQFDGVVVTGEPYTLDIYMGNTDEYDYVIENCVFNSKLSIMDNYGCLRKTAFFVEKRETDQYNRPGSIKRTLIHFLADQPILRFECQIRVIHCSGCAEQSCERRPFFSKYPNWNMPLNCCGNYPPPYPPVPPVPPPIQPAPFYRDEGWWNNGWFWGLPWYLWLIFLILFLLLLCCLCGLIAWCFAKGRRKQRDNQYSRRRSFTPPPPAPHSDRIYTIDGAAQTLPELKQASQQVDMHESYSRTNYFTHPQKEHAYNLRQVDNHASIDLHPETSRRAASAAYTNHVFDGDFYEEDLHERAFTKYDKHNNQRQRNSSTPHTIPIQHQRHRSSNSYNAQEERRLQRELEEHLAKRTHFEDRSDEFVERIEEQLRSQHYHQQQRHVEPEAFREETVHSMRQSSVL